VDLDTVKVVPDILLRTPADSCEIKENNHNIITCREPRHHGHLVSKEAATNQLTATVLYA